MVSGKRERVYVYFDKELKLWAKEEATRLNISTSKFIHDLVENEYNKDLRLDLDLGDSTNV